MLIFLIYSAHGRGRAFKDVDPEVVQAIFWSVFMFWVLLVLITFVRWNIKLMKRRKEREVQARQNSQQP